MKVKNWMKEGCIWQKDTKHVFFKIHVLLFQKKKHIQIHSIGNNYWTRGTKDEKYQAFLYCFFVLCCVGDFKSYVPDMDDFTTTFSILLGMKATLLFFSFIL